VSKRIGMTIAPAVTGRSLLESPSTQVRLEGRPLGMSSSLILSESSRLRLLDSSTHGIGGLGVFGHSSLAGEGRPAKWKNDRL
jgi:hypothetical protein